MSDPGANTPDTKSKDERSEAKIIIFVNVHFNLMSSIPHKVKSQDSYQQFAVANILQNDLVFHSNTQLLTKPDSILLHECTIPCRDLYFNQLLECIDPLGEFFKILWACKDIDEYLNQLVIPDDSKVQVCFNIIAYQCISDVAWGLASLLDLSCSSNIQNDILIDLIAEIQEPVLGPYIEKGWSINVVGVNLIDNGLIYQIDIPKDSNENSNSANNDKNTNNNSSTNTPSQYSAQNAQQSPIAKEDIPEEPTITLTGHVSKSHIVLSAFKETLRPIINPFYVIDKLTGADKMQDDINEHAIGAIQSYINGDKDAAKKHLKATGSASLDLLHNRLDIISFVPGPGTPASIANGLIYTVEEAYLLHTGGNWKEAQKNALISYVCAIPFAKIAKFAKSSKILQNNKTLAILVEKAEQSKKEAQELFKSVKKTNVPRGKGRKAARARAARKEQRLTTKDNRIKAEKHYEQVLGQYQEFQKQVEKTLRELGGMTFQEMEAYMKMNRYNKFKFIMGSNMPKYDIGQSVFAKFLTEILDNSPKDKNKKE